MCELPLTKVCSIDTGPVKCGKIISLYTRDTLQLQLGFRLRFSLSVCLSWEEPRTTYTHKRRRVPWASIRLDSALTRQALSPFLLGWSPGACFRPHLFPCPQSHLLRARRVNCVRARVSASDHAWHSAAAGPWPSFPTTSGELQCQYVDLNL